MPFDGCPHFTARDGRLYRVLPDDSEEPYWSPEEGRVLRWSRERRHQPRSETEQPVGGRPAEAS